MYFPYFRGRQFELIAIRELVEKGLLSRRVMPVIEPIKLSSALMKTLEVFCEREIPVGVVWNPRVGSMSKDMEDPGHEKERWRYEELFVSHAVQPFLYVDGRLAEQLHVMDRRGMRQEELAVISMNSDAIPVYESAYYSSNPRFNFIKDESVFRRRMPEPRVLFENRFPKKSRNVDYALEVDEPFSSDHLYYRQDGYAGFSDFSIVGDEYSESGFAPYAIAIHIVYFDGEGNLRVRHFVSDTNDDITDPAGKFAEALEKLVIWNQGHRLATHGIRALEELYEKRVYPGLGTVKKLAIMHHLEMMDQFLNEGERR